MVRLSHQDLKYKSLMVLLTYSLVVLKFLVSRVLTTFDTPLAVWKKRPSKPPSLMSRGAYFMLYS